MYVCIYVYLVEPKTVTYWAKATNPHHEAWVSFFQDASVKEMVMIAGGLRFFGAGFSLGGFSSCR